MSRGGTQKSAAGVGKRKSRAERGTASLLVEAATQEFEEHGFDGTDSNKIARRAGFSPQTFYRWFPDKTAIFVAVYQAWVRAEYQHLDALREQNAPDGKLIDSVIAHHRTHRIFRRSLRQLTVTDDRVRQARAESRLAQIEYIKDRCRPARRSTAEVAIFVFQCERLYDAVADGELADLGVSEDSVRAHLEQLFKWMRRRE